MEITYVLPDKAKEIYEELYEGECCEAELYLQLSVMLANAGFQQGANWAWEKSQSERSAGKYLLDYAKGRGASLEVEDYEKEKSKATDMKSAVLEAAQLELKALQRMEKACRMMFDIDLISYSELLSSLNGQKYEFDEVKKMLDVFGNLEGFEAQHDAQTSYFAPNLTDTPVSC